MIDKDRIKGSAEQAKGKVKEWTGKATGDKKTEAEGKAEHMKGKARNAVGGIGVGDTWQVVSIADQAICVAQRQRPLHCRSRA